MAVVIFAIGDKDYTTKLNTMSQQAGDVQQAKTDAEQAVVDAAQEVVNAQGKVDLANQALADAVTAKNQAQAIALADINGTNPDFASVKVAGVNVATVNNISNMDNTADADKPISTATQAALNVLNAKIVINKRIARAGIVI